MYDLITRKEAELFAKYKTTNEFSKGLGFRFLFDYYNELAEVKNEYAKSPIQVGLNITNACNLRCKHCSRRGKLKNLDDSDFMKNTDYVLQKLFDADVMQIFVTGGEPLLHPEIRQIISQIKQRGMLIGLLTNGMLMTEEMAKYLSEKFTSPFDYVHLSIDGVEDGYEKFRCGANYNKILETIKLLVKYNVRTHVVMVVTDDNYLQMYEVYNMCIKNNIKYLKFMSLFENKASHLKRGNTPLLIKEFCKILVDKQKNRRDIDIMAEPIALIYPFAVWIGEKYPDIAFPTGKYICPAGRASCEISIEGNVYPCSYLEDKKFYMGNIYEKSIEEIWKEDSWGIVRDRTIKKEKCLHCKELKNCMGGCPASSHTKFGQFNVGDGNCDFLASENF